MRVIYKHLLYRTLTFYCVPFQDNFYLFIYHTGSIKSYYNSVFISCVLLFVFVYTYHYIYTSTNSSLSNTNLHSELFPLHSPLLWESLLVSFPPLSYMLKFSGLSLFYQMLSFTYVYVYTPNYYILCAFSTTSWRRGVGVGIDCILTQPHQQHQHHLHRILSYNTLIQ